MRTTIFVHPGYMRRKDGDCVDVPWIKQLREKKEYGSYQEYLGNLKKLHASISTDAVFFVELKNQQLHPYHKGFEPKAESKVIQWNVDHQQLFFFKIVERVNNRWKQRSRFKVDKLTDILRAEGIDDVLLAGELGPYEGSHEGCVGRIFFLLEGCMQVKGVMGCIFPTKQYEYWMSDEFKRSYMSFVGREDSAIFKRQERLYRDLYEKAVLF